MLRTSKTAALLGAGILAIATATFADTVMNHEPGTYKMTKFGDSGDSIPLNGPVIHVFSKDGKSYTTIANDNENLKHASRVGGICGRRSHKFKSPSIEVAGTSHVVGGAGGHAMQTHTESFEFPFTLPDISRKPAAACNFELEKRVAQTNKTRQYWMSRGFAVRYEGAYEAKFSATCSGGLPRATYEAETIKTPVWIACAATEVSSDSKPNKLKAKPVSRAKQMPMKVTAKLEASQKGNIYTEDCPARVTYTGSIFVSRPNTQVSYQITGSGWESPERTITIEKAGTRKITSWTQYYREKETDTKSIAAPDGNARKQADASGSAILKVKYKGGTAQSEAIPYKVFCNAAAPRRAVIKTAD